MSRRRIMRAFRIDEISGVDSPAQEGARVAIMKRDDSTPITDRPAQKMADLLTTEEDGHQHGVTIRRGDGEVPLRIYVDYSYGDIEDSSHQHPITRDADGRYVLGVVAGHTHTIDQDAMSRAVLALITKKTADTTGKGGGKMPDKQKTDASTEPTVAALQKQLDRANAVIALSSAERAHYAALSDEAAQDAFLAKSADERQREVLAGTQAAQDADPVVYTTRDGVELRKSAGEALIAMAKSNDAIAKENATLRAEREQAALEKRAEAELSHLPGDVKTRSAMLRAIDAIDDDAQCEAAHNALKANNAAMSTAFETHGHNGHAELGDAEDGLEKLAKAYAEKHDVSHEAAYAEVLKTDEGKALYAKALS